MTSDRLTAFGETLSIDDWSRRPACAVDAETLRLRVERGVPPERAITAADLPQDADDWSPDSPPDPQPAEERATGRGRKRHSSYIGVSWRNGCWIAQMRETRASVKYLGQHDTELAAALAYDNEARKHGKKLNFPSGPPEISPPATP